MNLKSSLAVVGLCGVLATSGMSVIGCSGNNSSRIVRTNLEYSKLEDRVYNLVDGFSREIPEGFVKNKLGTSYQDSSLISGQGPKVDINDTSGAGRFITKTPVMINAGYVDAEEAKMANRTGDSSYLKKSSGFIKYLNPKATFRGYIDDFLSLSEGDKAVMYMLIDGEWRVKNITLEKMGGNGFGDFNELKALPTIPKERVQRYLDLSERLERTFFK